MMYRRLWYVITYPTTYERRSPIELHQRTHKEGAELVASMYSLKEPSIVVKVYEEYPNGPNPEQYLLASYNFQWVMKPQARLV